MSSQTTYRQIGLLSDLKTKDAQPDTTAIILNWSRFPNVKRIAALLCSPSLDAIIAEVFIWNNSSTKISYDDFRDTGCPPSKLRIHNSPANLYFQARFMACQQVNTPFCFIQDDDYLIIPEVIHTLHAELLTRRVPSTIHLLPAHEHLSTSLREVHVATDGGAAVPAIHTGFAWLGHGAILHSSEAVAFLNLMRALEASDDEMKMADNYYTILGNRVPEAWFDQGVALGGGEPFTVGPEGDERNNRHIVRAAEYLTSIAAGEFASSRPGKLPYISYDRRGFDTSVTRAACREARCLLETNISLLPSGLESRSASARDILRLEAHHRGVLGAAGTELYVNHPPSRAVDGRLETFFLSPHSAKAGEVISLDFFDDIRTMGSWAAVEMVWVVDANTERTLRACILESSLDGATWHSPAHEFSCRQALLGDTQQQAVHGVGIAPSSLRECIFKISFDANGSSKTSGGRGRRYRVKLMEDQPAAWRVHKIYMRGSI